MQLFRIVPMTYDFDILSVVPSEIQSKYAGLFSQFGMTEQAGQQLAMFRDQAVADALAGASEEVKACFVESGFALNRRDSGTGQGKYSASDTPARVRVLERLRRNVEKLPEEVNWNGFDIDTFFAEAGAAEPVDRVRCSFADVRRTFKPRMSIPAAPVRPLSTPTPG